MELYIDLLKNGKKSKYKVFIGITLAVLGITYFVSKMFLKIPTELSTFSRIIDWLFLISFTSWGIITIFQGIGKPLESKIGEAFISIDEQSIRIKKSIYSKEVIYSWDKIKYIRFGTNRFLINDSEILAEPDKVTNDEFVKLRSVATKIAFDKGIEN